MEKINVEKMSKKHSEEEASMVKAKATELSGTKYVEKEPSATHYEKALKMVEEIRQAAENEPVIQKVLYKIGRFLVYAADFGLESLSYESPTRSYDAGIRRPPGHIVDPHLGRKGYFTPDMLINLIDKLNGAQKELQNLKKEAKQ